MCQRPERASFISTWLALVLWNGIHILQNCVNALNGLLSFLRNDFTVIACAANTGVNALNGLLSFLRYEKFVLEAKNGCVNALNGLLSFLQNEQISLGGKQYCVNALNGLLSFLQKC